MMKSVGEAGVECWSQSPRASFGPSLGHYKVGGPRVYSGHSVAACYSKCSVSTAISVKPNKTCSHLGTISGWGQTDENTC